MSAPVAASGHIDDGYRQLSWLDYAVFAFSLSLSVGTGVYHAIKSRLIVRGRGGPSAKDEYLIGGRKMPALPVALSLLTTFLSGILMLGVPAEVFQRGPQVWLNFAIGVSSSIFTAIIFLPIFHKMQSTCLHEYFIHRYRSVLIRRLFSGLFFLMTVVYMSVVIYAPAVALSAVFGVSKWHLILIFGSCTTLYTCIGGLKAVVWTDSLQACLMYGGVSALIYKGLNHPRVGGLDRVLRIASESGRLGEMWRWDVGIAQYNSIWINLISGTITWLAAFGVNQLAIQRYVSLPDLKTAQGIIYYTLLPFFVLCSIVAFVGLLVLAYFHECNPLETGQIAETDHITILFARDVLQPTPGLFGLYVSCIMSATLSTLSSGMNSMAAAIYEDFLKQKLDGKITDTQATQINKLIVVLCGLLSTILAFAAEPLGGILRVCISVMGAMSGPMVAIFVLAIFFPASGVLSCGISFVLSNLAMAVICLSNYLEDPYKDLFLHTNTSVTGCTGQIPDPRGFTIRQSPAFDAHYGDPNTLWISRISTYGYSLVGFVLMLAIAIPLTYILKEKELKNTRHLTWPGRNDPTPASEHELDHFLKEIPSTSTLN
ncbi:unnamed protein product, partial [Mesorhabditis spiculigera]